MFGSKFTKFLSFLKQQISFYSNCVSLFSVMRHNSSTLFLHTFYILSTKGAYQKETCCFKHEEFCEFSLNHHHKSRNFTSMGLFCSQYMSLERKIYRGVIFYETEQWCKIWKTLTLWFHKWHEELGELSLEHSALIVKSICFS